MKNWSIFRSLILVVLAGLPSRALFTGDEQFDRENLNTERRVDSDYVLDLLAFRPFWENEISSRSAKAWARNTEGSLDSDRLYIWRDIGVRGDIGRGGYWGYRLLQREDVEESFFSQRLEMQSVSWGPLAFRIFGEPTFKKQSSDLGAGLALKTGRTVWRVDGTKVDFNYSGKNLDDNRDNRNLYNVVVAADTAWDEARLSALFEWDSPVERQYTSENIRFGHKNLEALLTLAAEKWTARAGWRQEDRTIDSLAGGARQQAFEKDVLILHLVREGHLWGKTLRLGAQGQRRDIQFLANVPVEDPQLDQLRWDVSPHVEVELPTSGRSRVELGVYLDIQHLKTREMAPDTNTTLTLEGKLKTAWRIDFTPDVTLYLNPTWDLDEFGSRRTFDGGNVQFRARIL